MAGRPGCTQAGKMRRERGESPQKQATRIDGQSVRAFAKYREILAIAGFGPRTHSQGKGKIKRRVARNVRKSAKTRRDRKERTQNPATRIDGRPVRVFGEAREIPPAVGFGCVARSRCEGMVKGGVSETY